MHPKSGGKKGPQNCIGPTIRIGREILCLPYAGFSSNRPTGPIRSSSGDVHIYIYICPLSRIFLRGLRQALACNKTGLSIAMAICPSYYTRGALKTESGSITHARSRRVDKGRVYAFFCTRFFVRVFVRVFCTRFCTSFCSRFCSRFCTPFCVRLFVRVFDVSRMRDFYKGSM